MEVLFLSCVFCNIANGVFSSNTVFENENFRVILDIAPANLGHCLILPKEHAENIFEMSDELVKEAFSLAKRTANKLRESRLADGVNILQNNGEAAGQTVGHFHIHVIPRKENDEVTIKAKTYDLEESEAMRVMSLLKEI